MHWDYDCYGAPGKIAQGRPAMMPNWDKDVAAGRALLTTNGLPVFEAPLHLEGGSIHSDGQGTMVVTEECLLDPSRNPHLDKAGIENVRRCFHFPADTVLCMLFNIPQRISAIIFQRAPCTAAAARLLIAALLLRFRCCSPPEVATCREVLTSSSLHLEQSEVSLLLPFFDRCCFSCWVCCTVQMGLTNTLWDMQILKEYLGLEKIIWLWRGMEGDTEVVNGHVDNMCCFIRPGVVALAWSDNVDDPQVCTSYFVQLTFLFSCPGISACFCTAL